MVGVVGASGGSSKEHWWEQDAGSSAGVKAVVEQVGGVVGEAPIDGVVGDGPLSPEALKEAAVKHAKKLDSKGRLPVPLGSAMVPLGC